MPGGRQPEFVFVDLETTGLNHHEDSILEVGLMVTDIDLVHIASASWVLNLMLAPTPHESWSAWGMHQKNGLYRDCVEKGLPYHHVQNKAIAWMQDQGVDGGKFAMCGSSVHFDRRFLMQQMPGLEAEFHYRNLDVSTLKVMCNKWSDIRWPSTPNNEKPHRVLSDITESIAELGFYRSRFGLGGDHL